MHLKIIIPRALISTFLICSLLGTTGCLTSKEHSGERGESSADVKPGNTPNIDADSDLGESPSDISQTPAPGGSDKPSSAPTHCCTRIFTGTGERADIPDLSFAGNFTFETWVHFAPGIDNNDALVGQAGKGQDISFHGGRMRFYAPPDVIVSNTVFAPEQWYHVALVRESGTLKLFVDGKQEATASWNGVFAPQVIGSGNMSYYSGKTFAGSLDELRFWNVARTPAQLLASLSGKQGDEFGLVAHYRFDDGDGTLAVSDSSGSGLHGQVKQSTDNSGGSEVVGSAPPQPSTGGATPPPAAPDDDIVTVPPAGAEVCDNLLDDDGNGLLDCQEYSCQTTSYCRKPASQKVYFASTGKLNYARDADNEILHDYSHAGYQGGGVALPTVADTIVVNPQSGDDTARIQAALNQLAARTPDNAGFRGAVRLAPGTYELSSALTLNANGMVLRGSGASQTILIHNGTDKAPTIHTMGSGESGDTAHTLLDKDIPMGTRVVHVSPQASQQLAVGDTVFINANRTSQWLQAMGMAEEWSGILSRMSINWEREIVAINRTSGAITLNTPTPERINQTQGHHNNLTLKKVVSEGRRTQIGIEDLTLLSAYNQSKRDPHGSGYPVDMDHAKVGINLWCVKDVWVRRVAMYYYMEGGVVIGCGSSYHATIEDVAVIDMVSTDTPLNHSGATKYAIDLRGNEALVQRTYVRNSRHAYVINGPIEGNVVVDSYATLGHLASEPHNNWSLTSLYDNVYSDSMFKLNRVEGHAHGQRAGNSTLYNVISASSRTWEPEIWLANAPNGLGKNYAFGAEIKGVGQGINTRAVENMGGTVPTLATAWSEQAGQSIRPRSLYYAQLWSRLGNKAVMTMTSAEQRTSRESVWNRMNAVYSKIPTYPDYNNRAYLPKQYPFEN